jgi:hypothetical protein
MMYECRSSECENPWPSPGGAERRSDLRPTCPPMHRWHQHSPHINQLLTMRACPTLTSSRRSQAVSQGSGSQYVHYF